MVNFHSYVNVYQRVDSLQTSTKHAMISWPSHDRGLAAGIPPSISSSGIHGLGQVANCFTPDINGLRWINHTYLGVYPHYPNLWIASRILNILNPFMAIPWYIMVYILVGGWPTPLSSSVWWTSMNFPTEWKVIIQSMVPVTTNQYLWLVMLHILEEKYMVSVWVSYIHNLFQHRLTIINHRYPIDSPYPRKNPGIVQLVMFRLDERHGWETSLLSASSLSWSKTSNATPASAVTKKP